MRSSRGTLKIAQIETEGRWHRLLVLLSVALLSPCGAAAQGAEARPWQRMQMPTAAQVSAVWKNPPPEYGPQPYFDMSGAIDQAEVERDLDEMKALGFRAVTAQAGVNLPFDYLSEDYFRFFRMLVAEAKKRDMRVWIVDDIGYPSGFAGGRFTREKPELRMQTLAVAERFAVAVTAIGDDHSTIAIPVSNGLIDWAAPGGRWQVLVVEHRFETSPTRSETGVPQPAPDRKSTRLNYSHR